MLPDYFIFAFGVCLELAYWEALPKWGYHKGRMLCVNWLCFSISLGFDRAGEFEE